MAKITYIAHSGEQTVLDVPTGQSVMQGAVNNAVRGIIADCGGACSCATCMVYVPDDWFDRLPPKDSTEQAMLEFCPHVQKNSRLSCQIKVSDALDGLRLKVPQSQQ